MRVIEVPVRKPAPKHHYGRLVSFTVIALVVLAGTVNYFRPLPSAALNLHIPRLSAASTPQLVWPATGQAAVGAEGFGVLATNGSQTPVATASVAKVITALCILQKAPLKPGENGPTYTISPEDVSIYNDYAGQDGSVVSVAAGQQFTERQALEALLLPSANNIADSLAVWVFGGQSNYAIYATQFLTEHGLVSTHIGIDASGFDPSTTSTANDLVRLGLLALQNPVLMTIAGEAKTTLPGVGTVYNYNTVLGQSSITGLKTGNSDADPGAFLFTSVATIGGKQVKTVGAVLGAASLDQALHSSVTLAGSLNTAFDNTPTFSAHQVAGTAKTAWGTHADIVTAQELSLLRWKGNAATEKHSLKAVRGTTAAPVGSIQLTAGPSTATTSLVIQQPARGPSLWWRLTRH